MGSDLPRGVAGCAELVAFELAVGGIPEIPPTSKALLAPGWTLLSGSESLMTMRSSVFGRLMGRTVSETYVPKFSRNAFARTVPARPDCGIVVAISLPFAPL